LRNECGNILNLAMSNKGVYEKFSSAFRCAVNTSMLLFRHAPELGPPSLPSLNLIAFADASGYFSSNVRHAGCKMPSLFLSLSLSLSLSPSISRYTLARFSPLIKRSTIGLCAFPRKSAVESHPRDSPLNYEGIVKSILAFIIRQLALRSSYELLSRLMSLRSSIMDGGKNGAWN